MHTFSPHSKAESAKVNENFTDLSTGQGDVDNNSLLLYRADSMPDFVRSGLVWTVVSGLNGTMTAGIAYVKDTGNDMQRVDVATITSRTFTANKDTYIDVGADGIIYYTEVANNATSGMALSAGRKRLCLVITNGTNITTVRSLGFDPLNNRYYNTVTKNVIVKAGNSNYWLGNDGSDNLMAMIEWRRPLDALTINSRTARIQTSIRGNATGVASVYRVTYQFKVGANYAQIESSGVTVGSTASYQNLSLVNLQNSEVYWCDYDMSAMAFNDVIRMQLNRDGAAGADTLASSIELENVELWYNKDYTKAP